MMFSITVSISSHQFNNDEASIYWFIVFLSILSETISQSFVFIFCIALYIGSLLIDLGTFSHLIKAILSDCFNHEALTYDNISLFCTISAAFNTTSSVYLSPIISTYFLYVFMRSSLTEVPSGFGLSYIELTRFDFSKLIVSQETIK